MSVRPRFRWISSLALSAGALLPGAACASFRGNDLEVLDRRTVLAGEWMPAITYVVTVGEVNFASPGWPSTTVHRVLREAFEDVRNAEPSVNPHLEIFFESRARHMAFSMGLSLLTLVTIGIVPSYGRDDLLLGVQVVRDGGTVWRRDYRDHRTWWVHLFMIPWAASRDVEEVRDDVLENMLLHVVRDLRADPTILAPVDAARGSP